MAKTTAQRMREYRARKKAGRCVLNARIEVDRGSLADDLVERRLLGAWDSESTRAVALVFQQELRKLLNGAS